MRFHGLVGILPHERDIPQPIEIDLTVTVAAGEGVIDYRELYALCANSVAGQIDFLEGLADAHRQIGARPFAARADGAGGRAEAARRPAGSSGVRRGRRRAPGRWLTWPTSHSDRTWATATSTWLARATRSRSSRRAESWRESSIEETAPLGQTRPADVPQPDGRARNGAHAAAVARADSRRSSNSRVARAATRWAPRTLDLDIVCFDGQTVERRGLSSSASWVATVDLLAARARRAPRGEKR